MRWMKQIDRRISCAPMMDWTDRHCRYFLRGFSKHVLLYTEMITAAAILRGDRERLLRFDAEEHPVALQLGGSEPKDLAKAARAGEEAGYDEINLNCGCPSDRVSSGSFGACLMHEPARVADCVAAMKATVRVPVTVKMRIGVVESARGHAAGNAKQAGGRAANISGVSEQDLAHLHDFVTRIRDAGCDVAIVHARKAVLGGLSPKENREIPPLRYDVVRELKRAFPALPVIVNGGFRDVPTTLDALTWSDGVMLGREAYHRPMVLAELDAMLRAHASVLHQEAAMLEPQAVLDPQAAVLHPKDAALDTRDAVLRPKDAVLDTRDAVLHPQAVSSTRAAGAAALSREALLDRMAHYASRELARGERLSSITRHMLGLYAGEPGAREYRRMLSEGARAPGASPELIRRSAPARSEENTRIGL
jgi:tRNA-dihydrouridine synthase A